MFVLALPAIDNYAERSLTVFDLERFTNDGSPSGHTFTNSSSVATTAWHGLPDFPLPILRAVQIEEYGNSSLSSMGFEMKSECPVHPDCIHLTGHQMLSSSESWRRLLVAPTSSPRVVMVLPERRFALKLHYPKKLGRFDRPLLGEQLKIGVDISGHLTSHNFKFSEFFPEIYAAEYAISPVGTNTSEQRYGFLLRDLQPTNFSKLEWAVPAFSLLAQNNLGLLRQPLIYDLVRWTGLKNKLDFICECFLPVLCRSISELVLLAGIWPEVTSQNFFLGKNKNGSFKIFWRDFQGCFVDQAILTNSGYSGALLKYKYHAISPGQEQWRSYLIDDVFNHHIISPILKLFNVDSDREKIISVLKALIVSTGLNALLPGTSYTMQKRSPRRGERIELTSLQKPIWRS
jgi:hypothetical protein